MLIKRKHFGAWLEDVRECARVAEALCVLYNLSSLIYEIFVIIVQKSEIL